MSLCGPTWLRVVVNNSQAAISRSALVYPHNSCGAFILLWQFAPKTKSSGKKTVDIAVYISVGLFDEGKNTLLAIMNELGLKVGQNCLNEAQAQDEDRVARAEASTSGAFRSCSKCSMLHSGSINGCRRRR